MLTPRPDCLVLTGLCRFVHNILLVTPKLDKSMHLTLYEGRFMPRKLLLIMKLTTVLLLVATLQVSARSYSQKVSISGKDLSIGRVFELIKQQTGYAFVADQQAIAKVPAITLHVKDASLEEVLNQCLKNQPFSYSISDKIIVISGSRTVAANEAAVNTYYAPPPAQPLISGIVTDENGQPVVAASVRIPQLNKGVQTDGEGRFRIEGVAPGKYTLVVSSLGFAIKELTVQVAADKAATVTVKLQSEVNKLDETVVRGYYETSRRLNTGNVSTVKAEDIARQPVGDPMAALQGRVTGLMISASNGLPASSFNITIRGRSSVANANEPLYVIDGVPYISESMSQFNSANGAQSPFSMINPNDIERIDILKDADATSIYGSRGANGVILITTKKGKAGKTKFDFNAYTGNSKVVNKLDMLNTEQYLQMREEAFRNDKVTPNQNNAPDLLLWDKSKSTDWQDYMIGHTAHMTNVNASVSGGSQQTRFVLSGTYRRETTVLRNDEGYNRGAVHFNIDHSSLDNKFNIVASVNYSADKNNSLATDLTTFYDLAPNYPLYDENGAFYWFNNEQNPEAYLNRKSNSRTNNLIANTTIRYTLLPGLNLKTRLGYNQSSMKQVQLYPDKVFNPVTSTGSMTYFGNSELQSHIIEPQVDYSTKLGLGKFQVLAGATWQQSLKEGRFLMAEGFSSDELMEDINSATSITPRSTLYRWYRYTSVFGRANYNIADKYLVNATFRRDGSTRFGEGKRFGNFGSIGAAWIFSNESFIPTGNFLSFGKLRASYGSSGNDNLADYGYLDGWSSVSFPYDGVSGISPSRIANPNYSWEQNTKLEFGVELGFLKDRIFLAANYYRNVSDNQLVDYALSPQVGRPSVTANFPATVLNTGLELELNSTNVQQKDFSWKSSLNFTLPTNKLTAFPGIENSSYNNTYIVGKSLTIVQGYQFTGIDPLTGVPAFLDRDGDHTVSEYNDFVVLGKTMPSYYGGFQNSFTYKNFQLDFLLQFVKQEGPGVNYGYMSNPLGVMKNKDITALDRWTKEGDQTNVPRASLTSGNAAYDAYRNYYRLSSAVWENASFVRLKNVFLSYDLTSLVQQWKIQKLAVYMQGQNLLTFTDYKGMDPETQGTVLPPLKTFTAGLQLTF